MIKYIDSEINNFLDKWGTKCSENEDESITELMMDNHYYIQYNNKGYYINEMVDDEEEELLEYLKDNFSI